MIKSKIKIFGMFLIFSLYASSFVFAMEKEDFHTHLAKIPLSQNDEETPRFKDLMSSKGPEGFVKRRIDEVLEKISENYYSQALKSTVNLYACDENRFNQVFPVFTGKDFESYCVGQIQVAGGGGCATGTLVDMKYDNESIRFECITALHVFASFDETNGLSIRHGREFVLGRKAHETQEKKTYNLGVSTIEKVMFHKEPRDLCLFKGKFEPNKSLFPDEEGSSSYKKFYDQFNGKLPKIIQSKSSKIEVASKKELDTKILKTEADLKIDAYMYHYPFGRKSQRKNNGIANLEKKNHDMDSIYGSSGAAIFSRDQEIFAIHTGCDNWDKYNVVKIEGDKEELPIVNFNLFESFSKEDYDGFIDGIDLYSTSLSQELISKIGSTVENRLSK